MSETTQASEIDFNGPPALKKLWSELADAYLYSPQKAYRIRAMNTFNTFVFGSKKEQKQALNTICTTPHMASDLCEFARMLSDFGHDKKKRPLQDAIVASIAHHWIAVEKQHGLYPPLPISNGEGIDNETRDTVFKLRDGLLATPEGGFLYGFLFSVAHCTLRGYINKAVLPFAHESSSLDNIYEIATEEAYKLFQYSTFRFEENKGSKFFGFVGSSFKMGLFSKIKERLIDMNATLSIDAPIAGGEDDELNIGNTLKDEHQGVGETMTQSDMAAKSLEILSQMKDPRYAKVVRDRLGLNGKPQASLQEIANELHVTRERVRQMEQKGLKQIRKSLGAEANLSKGLSLNGAIAKYKAPKSDSGHER